jgi:hypothetical protein
MPATSPGYPAKTTRPSHPLIPPPTHLVLAPVVEVRVGGEPHLRGGLEEHLVHLGAVARVLHMHQPIAAVVLAGGCGGQGVGRAGQGGGGGLG